MKEGVYGVFKLLNISYKWKMYFSSEEERLEFRTAIERAENDPISYTQEEVDRYFFEKYGI